MRAWSDGPVVVLGAGGMLARDLLSTLGQRLPAANLLTFPRSDLDITDRQAVHDRLRQIGPSVVINCAAYTDVDGCEANVDQAHRVNGVGPGLVGQACNAAGALLLHYSTDFVFDGSKHEPYHEYDATNPLSHYGKSKLEGEQAVAASGAPFLILRTSWLYGLHGRNFVEAILGRAQKGESLKVVTDQVGRPTYTVDLAEATIRLLDENAKGIVHFANNGQCSWHVFACEIVRLAGYSMPVGTLSSVELNRAAKRPAYSVMDLGRFASLSKSTPRSWNEALAAYLESRNSGVRAA